LGTFQLQFPTLCRPALSVGGKYFAVGAIADDGPLVLVDVAAGRQKRLHGHRYSVNSVVFSPDGTQLASVASDAMLKIWDCATGAEIFSTMAHLVQASCVDWSADGRTLATISEGEGFKLWHARTRREVLFWPLHEAGNHITFSPDGRWLAVARFAEPSQSDGPLWLLPIPRD
jgi:WD40 repeat protein